MGDVNGVDAVHEGLVGLGHECEAALGKPFDEVHLPQRSATVKPFGLDPRDELLQLVVTARTWQCRTPDVIGDVKVDIVDPHRVGKTSRDLADSLPVAGHEGNPVGDQRDQTVVVESLVRWLEDHDRAHMHGCRRLLQIEEGRIKGGQPVGHALIVSEKVAQNPNRDGYDGSVVQ